MQGPKNGKIYQVNTIMIWNDRFFFWSRVRSCVDTCRAANFASSTSCTIFFSARPCNQLFPLAAALAAGRWGPHPTSLARGFFFVAINWFVHSSLALNKSWHDFVHVIFYLLSDVAEAVRTRINFFKHFCHNWNAAEQWSSENTEKLEKLWKFSYFLFTLSNMSLVAGFNQVTKLAAGSTNWIFWLSG